MLRKVFGPKVYEVTEVWTELHNEELYDLYFSRNIIRVIISRRMRRAGHVAGLGGEARSINGLGGQT